MPAATGSEPAPAPAPLRVEGPLSFGTAASVLQTLQASLTTPVEVIDLGGVTECDSAGLACVLALLSTAQQRDGREIRLQNVPAGLRALAEVAGLGKVFG